MQGNKARHTTGGSHDDTPHTPHQDHATGPRSGRASDRVEGPDGRSPAPGPRRGGRHQPAAAGPTIARVSDSLSASTIQLAGHGGDEIEAYLARPDGAATRGGVVVIHHMPGYDRASKEIVRRFAELGYDAICPNLHYREAPGAAPDDASAAVRAAGGVPDDRLVGDVAGAAAYLRARPSSNGKVGVIGHCSGGRHAFLAACHLDLQAAVDCYGAFVVGDPPEGFPLAVT